MALNTRAIKQRIVAVKNTQKMTRALEMVSASKMRKAVVTATKIEQYARHSSELLSRLSAKESKKIPLLQKRKKIKNTLVILITSNRGFCGSYNSNVIKKTQATIQDFSGTIHVVGIGRKSALFAKKYAYALPLVFDDLKEKPEYEDVLPIATHAIQGFLDETYDEVFVAYTRFHSAISQEVRVEQILPLSRNKIHELSNGTAMTGREIDAYIFEPSYLTVAEALLPKLITTLLYDAVIHGSASEHSSRMVAMKNATENAGDMVKMYTLFFNKARQAAITQEISEIVGGAAALE